MQRLIAEAEKNLEGLNKGERVLARAAVMARDEALFIPTLGLGMDVVWDHDVTEIVEAAKKWNIDTMFYAGGQSGSLETLGLFTEAGASIGAIQKLTLKSNEIKLVDGKCEYSPKTVWAFAINI